MSENKFVASDGYARFQLAKAFATAVEHADKQVRENALDKIGRWQKVIDGMFEGSITVGSRKPVDAPEWITLEVVTGGFTTGSYLASGPLLEHELKLAKELRISVDESIRGKLNSYFISDEGLAVLRDACKTGRFDISVPEEGALLCVAWFLDQGNIEKANEILDAIVPFFGELRFYPVPRSEPQSSSSSIHLYSVGDIKGKIGSFKSSNNIFQQLETISVWLPLYDRFVSLFLSSVVGDKPEIDKGADGKLIVVEGKFRFAKRSESYLVDSKFRDGLVALLKEFDEQTKAHRLCKRPYKKNSSLYQIHQASKELIKNNFELNDRQKGRLDLILGRFVARNGSPNSAIHQSKRKHQHDQIRGLLYEDIAKELMNRLAAAKADDGLEDVSPYMAPIKTATNEDVVVPKYFRNKINKCLAAPISTLISEKIITSGDSLATVLPQVTANIHSMGFKAVATRRLYSSLYRVFRKRRSLLLLNYESQVKISEVPWVKALADKKEKEIRNEEASREALKEVVAQAITSFPYAIIPNKLLQEIRALSKTANVQLPIVDELAADIFMGSFAMKYQAAAVIAGKLLKGTLYERYYDINFQELIDLQPRPQEPVAEKKFSLLHLFGRPVAPSKKPEFAEVFAKICNSRAEGKTGNWSPAQNGTVIEQQQILTTQNLAPLFSELGLADALQGQLIPLAEKCLNWIFKRQQMKIDEWHAKLTTVKNCAYAWRQMIFFLSLVESKKVVEFIERMELVLKSQDPNFQRRFSPAWDGLKAAVDGQRPDIVGKVFLGWTIKRHWLLEPEDPTGKR